ncbi:HNH endonuclease [Belliella pelovolcani]|uniref:5-methylcytosine-specific restriction enzyme A n=1 Tax=Belliella pelovolcani TaxID=529505 RepID=A0A1N7MQT0_9BACT|nr:HNH endonuclease [Belliella pelovolcani]SIS88487.1 5-methylcytosine-specific restriction enzyme A [Belliella pelovolcani]
MQQEKKKYNNKGWGFDTDFYRKKDWLKLRKKYIDENPLCELHLLYNLIESASIVDHIVSRRITQDYELDEDNLQSLCYDCHQKKTALERNLNTLDQYIEEMIEGKLQYITTEEKKDILFKKIRGN